MDSHTLTVTVGTETLAVQDATLTMDRGWAPYVQGTLLVPGGADIDPRTFPRVGMGFSSWNATGPTADDLADLWAPMTADEIATWLVGGS